MIRILEMLLLEMNKLKIKELDNYSVTKRVI